MNLFTSKTTMPASGYDRESTHRSRELFLCGMCQYLHTSYSDFPKGFENRVSILCFHLRIFMSAGIVQSVQATGYRLDGGVSITGGGKRFFSTSQRSDPLWGPSSFLTNGSRGLFPRGLSVRGVMLTTHLHQVPRSRMVELYLHSPLSLRGIVVN
jgi:hypothetical protein